MILTQLPKKYKLTSVHVCVHSSVCVEAMIEQWKRNRDIRSMSCIRIDSHYCSIIRTKTSVIPNPFKPIVDECVWKSLPTSVLTRPTRPPPSSHHTYVHIQPDRVHTRQTWTQLLSVVISGIFELSYKRQKREKTQPIWLNITTGLSNSRVLAISLLSNLKIIFEYISS